MPSKSPEAILARVKGMMESVDAARLTQEQFAEITRLKTGLENACAAGDKDTAKRMERLIAAIIKEGPPAYG